jgi:hypothetical protein
LTILRSKGLDADDYTTRVNDFAAGIMLRKALR